MLPIANLNRSLSWSFLNLSFFSDVAVKVKYTIARLGKVQTNHWYIGVVSCQVYFMFMSPPQTHRHGIRQSENALLLSVIYPGYTARLKLKQRRRKKGHFLSITEKTVNMAVMINWKTVYSRRWSAMFLYMPWHFIFCCIQFICHHVTHASQTFHVIICRLLIRVKKWLWDHC